MGLNIGGMAAALEGYRQGQDEELARQRQLEDREYLKGQREHQKSQQQYQNEQQQRTRSLQGLEDARRTADAQIDTGLPQEAQIRKMAENARKAGAQQDWLSLSSEADKLRGARMAKQWTAIAGSASNMSAVDIANSFARMWGETQDGIKFDNIQPVGTDGVSATITDPSGATRPVSFNTKQEFLTAMQAFGDPATYANIAAEQRKAQIEILKKNSEPQVLKPGDVLTGVNSQGQRTVLAQNDEVKPGYERVTRPDGSTVLQKVGAAPKANEAQTILKDLLARDKESPPEVAGMANTFLEALLTSNPGLPPAAAANVALHAARNPQSVKPTLNVRTGEIDGVFRDPKVTRNQPYTVAPNYMKPQEAEAAFPDDKTFMRNQVQEMVNKQAEGMSKIVEVDGKPQRVAVTKEEAAQIQQTYIKAAFDPELRAKLEQAAQAASGPDAVASLRRKLDLIAAYLDNPSAPPKPTKDQEVGTIERMRGAGGIEAAAAFAPRASANAQVPASPRMPTIGGGRIGGMNMDAARRANLEHLNRAPR